MSILSVKLPGDHVATALWAVRLGFAFRRTGHRPLATATLLSWQVASVSCAIWPALFSLHRFGPSSFATRKPGQLPWSVWAPSSLSLRLLPSALRDNRPCTFPDSISSSCCRSVIWPCSSRVCRARSFSGHAVSLDPRVHRRNALTREQARHLPVLRRPD